MSASVKIKLNEKLFLRDPQETELGRNIINESIQMIDKVGFEQFTFKKLAISIESTEASIYRYFENKHKLLVYLVSWYWIWLDYQISFKTNNITSARERLKIIIRILSEAQKKDSGSDIDEAALHRIVISEASKAYLTKEVDAANKEGLYREYQKLCSKIAEIILEINPTYKYPHSLVSTIIETSRKQVFFTQHLPSLSDLKIKTNDHNKLTEFLEHILFSSIEQK